MDNLFTPQFRKRIIGLGDAYGGSPFWLENLRPRSHPKATWRALLYFACLNEGRYVDRIRPFLTAADSRVRAWTCFLLGHWHAASLRRELPSRRVDHSRRVRAHAALAELTSRQPEAPHNLMPITPPQAGRGKQVSGVLPPGRVIISNDSESLGEGLKSILQAVGLHVDVVGNEYDTLYWARSGRPDIIITDNQKEHNNLSGLEMLEEIYSEPKLREIILIMISADDVGPVSLWNGGDYFLPYPCNIDDLLRVVFAFLQA